MRACPARTSGALGKTPPALPRARHAMSSMEYPIKDDGGVTNLSLNVESAHERLQSWRAKRPGCVLWTPLMRSRTWLEAAAKEAAAKEAADGGDGGDGDAGGAAAPVYVKLESEQVTGSFKVRGALNAVAARREAARSASKPPPVVITASTGNHAMAVAHALETVDAAERGRIFLPTCAQPAKVAALGAYADRVDLEFTPGDDCVEAEAAAGRFARRTPGCEYISPCDSYDVVSGNGTIAVEVLRTLRETGALDNAHPPTVYVCVGGGGMIAGMGAYLKRHAPHWRVVGAQPEQSAVMKASVEAGKVVHLKSLPTLSDGSAGGLQDGCFTLGVCMKVVDAWITVSEEEIASAVKGFCEHHHKVIEGAAGVAVAAYLKDEDRTPSSPSIIVACGANIGSDALLKVLGGE